MADNTLWVGVLTAGTAVVASWVTSQGTARAARVQEAETTAAVQRADQRRAARRTAYADVIEQAQKIGDLYWKVKDAHADPDPESRTAGCATHTQRCAVSYEWWSWKGLRRPQRPPTDYGARRLAATRRWRT